MRNRPLLYAQDQLFKTPSFLPTPPEQRTRAFEFRRSDFIIVSTELPFSRMKCDKSAGVFHRRYVFTLARELLDWPPLLCRRCRDTLTPRSICKVTVVSLAKRSWLAPAVVSSAFPRSTTFMRRRGGHRMAIYDVQNEAFHQHFDPRDDNNSAIGQS